jgi:hypothetical protein
MQLNKNRIDMLDLRDLPDQQCMIMLYWKKISRTTHIPNSKFKKSIEVFPKAYSNKNSNWEDLQIMLQTWMQTLPLWVLYGCA